MRNLSTTFFAIFEKILIFNIEHTVAIALEIGVCYLLAEFFANTFVFLSPFQATGAVAAGALQTFLDHLDHFLVIVQSYSHGVHILSDSLYDRGEKCQG